MGCTSAYTRADRRKREEQRDSTELQRVGLAYPLLEKIALVLLIDVKKETLKE